MAKRQNKKNTTSDVADITLIIPVRGAEPMLQRAIDVAERTAGCVVDVLVIDNGYTGLAPCGRRVTTVELTDLTGTSAARHCGVLLAKTDLVVTIDAHVRLERLWGLRMLETYADTAWHQTVSCAHIGHLGDDFQPTDEPCYHGAKINWLDTSMEPRILAARWDREIKPGAQIGAIMGACYAFRRDWYDAMCQPWQVNRSWGCDEEVLSIASWLSGGDCRSLPEECRAWHHFSDRPGIRYTDDEITEIGLTRARMASLFPFSSAEREAFRSFLGWAALPPLVTDTMRTFADCYADLRPRLDDYLKTWVTGYKKWSTPPAPPAAAQIKTPPLRLAPRTIDVCDQCDGRDTFRVTSSLSTIIRYRCNRCGRTAWRIREGKLNFGFRND